MSAMIRLLVPVFVLGVNFSVLAKGLDQIAPVNPPEEVAEPEPPAKPTVTEPVAPDPEEELEKEKPEISRASQLLKDRFSLGTSAGIVRMSKSGTSWKASGAADITASYLLRKKIAGRGLAVTLRYLPIEVAPQISVDDVEREYEGVVQQYLFGAAMAFPLPIVTAFAAAEVGFAFANLRDQTGLAEETKPGGTNGVVLTLGGGVQKEIAQHFNLGAGLRLGFGSFSTTQFSVNASLLF